MGMIIDSSLKCSIVGFKGFKNRNLGMSKKTLQSIEFGLFIIEMSIMKYKDLSPYGKIL